MVTIYHQQAKEADKWFPLDKNYILKEVQFHDRAELLNWLVVEAPRYYLKLNNPLGLLDETAEKFNDSCFEHVEFLFPFYDKLCSLYRFKHGEIQLEFLFDGASHFEKYSKDWILTFKSWSQALMQRREVLLALLEMIVYHHTDERSVRLINQRLQFHIEHHFEVRLYRYRGIIDLQQA